MSNLKHRLSQVFQPYFVLPVVAVLLIGGIWFAAFAVIGREEREARLAAVQSTQRLLDACEAQVLRALNEVNQSFKLIEYGSNARDIKETLAELHQKNMLLPDIMFTTSVIDHDGKVIASTNLANINKAADPVILKKHLGGDEVYVSLPEKLTGDAEQYISISRTIGGAGGKFTHILTVRAPVSYLVSDYDEARFGKTGVLALVGTDGVIRAKRMGEVITAGERVDFQKAAPKADEQDTVAQLVISPWDKVSRYTAARKFFAFPMAVVVALSEADRLAAVITESQKNKVRAAIGSGLVALIAAVLTWLSWRLAQARKRELKQAAQLREKTNDIQSMLQNMPQGVLTVVSGLTIHPEYSAYLESIFETPEIAGRNVMDVFFKDSSIGADALSQVEAAVGSCIGEDMMNFEFNSHLFVTEIDKTMPDGREKSLALSWSAICGTGDTVEKLMICVRDVTELKRLEKEAGAQKRELERIGQILAISQEKFSEFIEGALGFIDENRQLIAHAPGKSVEVANVLFRNMHTIKGNARTYGLTHMTDLVHETEQGYDDLRKNDEAEWQPELLLSQLNDVEELVNAYARINENVLGRKGPGRRGSVEKYLMVEKERVDHFLQVLTNTDPSDINAMRGALSQIRQTLDLIGTESLKDILTGVTDSLPSLAHELGKDAPLVVVQDHGIAVRNQIAPLLKNAFTHLLRNAVDHGLERTEERLASGKPINGRIEVDLSVADGKMWIKLRDDGRGIPIAKIRASALTRGLMTEEQARSPHDIAMMIFSSGFSTATEVTQVSGRGVGLDAVKSFIEKEGGAVQIHFLDELHDADFRQFELAISLPDKYAASTEATTTFDGLRTRLSAGTAPTTVAHEASPAAAV